MRNGIRTTALGAGLLTLAATLLVAFDPATGDPPETKREKGEKRRQKKAEQEAALPDGAVLHLTFDVDSLCRNGGEIRVLDVSGKGSHATLRGAEPDVGRFGDAMSFNGVDSFLEGSDAALPVKAEPSTVSLWFYPRQNKFSGLFAYGYKGKHTARGIACNPATFVCYFRWQDGAADWRLQMPLKEWHHLAVTYDGTKSTLYVDGVEKGTDEKEFNTLRDVYIIGRNLNTQNWFDGLIDEVAVFNRALTADEVQKLFGRKPSPADEKMDLSAVKACEKP